MLDEVPEPLLEELEDDVAPDLSPDEDFSVEDPDFSVEPLPDFSDDPDSDPLALRRLSLR